MKIVLLIIQTVVIKSFFKTPPDEVLQLSSKRLNILYSVCEQGSKFKS